MPSMENVWKQFPRLRHKRGYEWGESSLYKFNRAVLAEFGIDGHPYQEDLVAMAQGTVQDEQGDGDLDWADGLQSLYELTVKVGWEWPPVPHLTADAVALEADKEA